MDQENLTHHTTSPTRTSQNLVLALIPAYNEQAHISAVVTGARQQVHVLVVDDGSTDHTAQLAVEAGAEVLTQNPNQGKGAALRAGFRRAIELGCDAVITLDADGQHDPGEISLFISAYNSEKADLIIGQRNFSKMPLSRRIANTVGKWSFSWALGQQIPDNQSGYRLISRRLMEALLYSQETGFEFEVEMISTCLKKHYRLAWVPVRTIYADEKSHIQPLKHAWNYFRIVREARNKMKS